MVPVTETFASKMLQSLVFLIALTLGLTQELPLERDSQGYGAPTKPSYNGNVGGGFDLAPLVIIALGLLGVSLLFPNYVSLTSVRRRRSADGTEGKVASQQHALKNNFIFQRLL